MELKDVVFKNLLDIWHSVSDMSISFYFFFSFSPKLHGFLATSSPPTATKLYYSHASVLTSFRPPQTWYPSHFDEKTFEHSGLAQVSAAPKQCRAPNTRCDWLALLCILNANHGS